MTPTEASPNENKNKVLIIELGGKTLTPRFSIGDNVRMKASTRYIFCLEYVSSSRISSLFHPQL